MLALEYTRSEGHKDTTMRQCGHQDYRTYYQFSRTAQQCCKAAGILHHNKKMGQHMWVKPGEIVAWHVVANGLCGSQSEWRLGACRTSWWTEKNGYSWIGCQLHVRRRPAFWLTMSDFKSVTIFEFPAKNYTGHVFWIFCTYCKTSKWARSASVCVF